MVLARPVTVLQTADEYLLRSICLEIDHAIYVDNPFENRALIMIGESLNSI